MAVAVVPVAGVPVAEIVPVPVAEEVPVAVPVLGVPVAVMPVAVALTLGAALTTDDGTDAIDLTAAVSGDAPAVSSATAVANI
jgi:hypothetical protein